MLTPIYVHACDDVGWRHASKSCARTKGEILRSFRRILKHRHTNYLIRIPKLLIHLLPAR